MASGEPSKGSKLSRNEIAARNLAAKYARQYHRKQPERAAMMITVLASLDRDQMLQCLRLMQEAHDRTSNETHRQECADAMAAIRRNLDTLDRLESKLGS